jgi:hypothetical protein
MIVCHYSFALQYTDDDPWMNADFTCEGSESG